jgi:hypothetical protein
MGMISVDAKDRTADGTVSVGRLIWNRFLTSDRERDSCTSTNVARVIRRENFSCGPTEAVSQSSKVAVNLRPYKAVLYSVFESRKSAPQTEMD